MLKCWNHLAPRFYWRRWTQPEPVGGHSHLVTVLLEQVLSGLRRRKSRLVRKWNMLRENRTPHLKTLTKKLFSFLLAVCISLSVATVCSAIRWAEWRHYFGTFVVKHPGRQKTPRSTLTVVLESLTSHKEIKHQHKPVKFCASRKVHMVLIHCSRISVMDVI